MACTCADMCPHSAHCIAMTLVPEGKCWLLCDKFRHEDEPAERTLDLDSPIDVDTRGVDVLQLAEALAPHSSVELLIPAASAREKVELSVKATAFGDVLEQAGIVAGGPVGRHADAAS